jgi:DNA mismatch repair ATPase MutS
MKAYLMCRDHDFDLERELPWNAKVLMQDLELETLFNAMALGDRFLFEVCSKAVLGGLNDDMATIGYRQAVLKDCLKNPSAVREIYQIPLEAIENRKKIWFYGYSSSYPSSVLSGAREMMEMFVDLLKKLKALANQHADRFESQGFTRFFAMIRKELEDDYIVEMENHLKELKFRNGVLISGQLGKGNEGFNYTLRKPNNDSRSWLARVMDKKPPVYTYTLHPRDEAGARALGELRDRGINLVANALAQSADHIDNFLKMLRIELAFYIGCLNLYNRLDQMGEPTAFPEPAAAGERRCAFQGLYDVCLALTMKQKIVGSRAHADGKDLVVITGANQGGKSTFLRSIGLAQLMMQCGMFVPAESFGANLCNGLFTHYKREEDAAMKSGKLDEELGRMSAIVDHVKPDDLILLNESFAATNEREGSEIARQITSALVEKRVKVFFVTHLYEFPRWFYDSRKENTLFLRAQRQADGKRSFKLIEGEPQQTSYGADLYTSIFETKQDPDAMAPAEKPGAGFKGAI